MANNTTATKIVFFIKIYLIVSIFFYNLQLSFKYKIIVLFFKENRFILSFGYSNTRPKNKFVANEALFYFKTIIGYNKLSDMDSGFYMIDEKLLLVKWPEAYSLAFF
jgi:hypothetical protein